MKRRTLLISLLPAVILLALAGCDAWTRFNRPITRPRVQSSAILKTIGDSVAAYRERHGTYPAPIPPTPDLACCRRRDQRVDGCAVDTREWDARWGDARISRPQERLHAQFELAPRPNGGIYLFATFREACGGPPSRMVAEVYDEGENVVVTPIALVETHSERFPTLAGPR